MRPGIDSHSAAVPRGLISELQDAVRHLVPVQPRGADLVQASVHGPPNRLAIAVFASWEVKREPFRREYADGDRDLPPTGPQRVLVPQRHRRIASRPSTNSLTAPRGVNGYLARLEKRGRRKPRRLIWHDRQDAHAEPGFDRTVGQSRDRPVHPCIRPASLSCDLSSSVHDVSSSGSLRTAFIADCSGGAPIL